MSSDYALGQSFCDLVRIVSPGSQQKLIALLNDLVGSDDELISAFRMLFSNPIFVSSFLSQAPLGPAELSSLNVISNKSLSLALSKRVDDFVSGYFESVGSKALRSPASLSNSSSQQASVPNKPVMPASSASSRQSPEEATVFANDHGNNSQINDQRPPSPIYAQSKQSKSVPIKAILIISVIALSAFSAFKIKAICEPFGLCSSDKSNKNDPKKESDQKSNINDTSNQRPADGNSTSNRESSTGKLDPSRSEQPRPNTKQLPPSPPQPNEAPMRDEPLW
jgi:hypothetical protein